MRSLLLITLLLTLLASACRSTSAGSGTETFLAHDVYFDLADDSDSACQVLIDDSWNKLSGLKGIEVFAVGQRGATFDGAVNATDYDVSLHVYFVDQAAYDAYSTAPEHLEFIETHSGNWASVRVFDSWIRM